MDVTTAGPTAVFFVSVLSDDPHDGRLEALMALLQSTRRVFWRTARLKEMVAERAETAEDAAE